MKKRLLSILTALALCLSLLPPVSLAAEAEESLCQHHPEHTEECGYIAPAEGVPCRHEHNADCYIETRSCVHVHDESCYSDGSIPAGGEEPAEGAEGAEEDAANAEEAPADAEEDPAGGDGAAAGTPETDAQEGNLHYDSGEQTADTCSHVCTVESGCVTRILNCQHVHDETCGYVEGDPGQPCGYECKLCPIAERIGTLPEHVTGENRDAVTEQLQEILSLYTGLEAEEQEQIDLTPCRQLQEELDGANLPQTLEGSPTRTDNSVASVKVGEAITYYADFLEAFNAAAGKTATIKLFEDFELTDTPLSVAANTDITLEESSSKVMLHASTGPVFKIDGGTLTLKIGGLWCTAGTCVEVNSGHLNVYGGTITGGTTAVSTAAGCTTLYGGTFIGNGTDPTITVTGGSVGDLLPTDCGYKLGYQDKDDNPITDTSAPLPSEVTIAAREPLVEFTQNPEGGTLACGGSLTLSAAAQFLTNITVPEETPITYEWYMGGKEPWWLSDEQEFDIGAELLPAGTYQIYCVATALGYPVESNVATVTVVESTTNFTAERVPSENAEGPDTYAFGDIIEIKTFVQPTGESAVQPAMLASTMAETTTEATETTPETPQTPMQIEVYENNKLLTSLAWDPRLVDRESQTILYLVQLPAAMFEPDTPHTLTLKFTGYPGMLAAAESSPLTPFTVKPSACGNDPHVVDEETTGTCETCGVHFDAKVGDNYYLTLDQAVAAALDENTENDVTITLMPPLDPEMPFVNASPFTVPTDKNLTIEASEGLYGIIAQITVAEGASLSLPELVIASSMEILNTDGPSICQESPALRVNGKLTMKNNGGIVGLVVGENATKLDIPGSQVVYMSAENRTLADIQTMMPGYAFYSITDNPDDCHWLTQSELDASVFQGNIMVYHAPAILATPASAEVVFGYPAGQIPALNATATVIEGTIINGYQWYKDGTAIEGATEATYTVPTGLAVGDHAYYCYVTCTDDENEECILRSKTATVTVIAPSTISAETLNGETETNEFTYGDAITVKAKPSPTIPATAAVSLNSLDQPAENQMALFYGDTQVSEPKDPDSSGYYVMTTTVKELVSVVGNTAYDNPVPLTAKFAGNDSMAGSEGNVQVTLKKRPVTATIQNFSITYDGNNSIDIDPKLITVDENDILDGDTLTFSNIKGFLKNVNVGTQDLTVTTITLENDNYTLSTAPTGTVTINKAQLTLEFPGADENNCITYTYGGTCQKAVASANGKEVTDVEITYSYIFQGGSLDNRFDGWPEDSGLYSVTATVEETDNYYKSVSQPAAVVILAKEVKNPTVTVNKTYPYTGEDILPAPEDVTVSYTENGETVTLQSSEYQITGGPFTDLGTYNFTIKDAAGGNYTVTGSGSFTIEQADLTGAQVVVTKTFTYNGAAQVPQAADVQVTLKNGKPLTADNFTVAASNNTNAGTASVTVEGQGNYTGTATGSFNINKATPTIAWSNPSQELTYTGNPAAITAPPVTLQGSDTFSGTINYSYEKDGKPVEGLPTDAGSYTVTASIAATDNYTAATSAAPLTLTISKSQPTIRFKAGYNPGREYNGQQIDDPVADNLEITDATFEDVTFSWSDQPLNAGTYTLTATIEDTSNTNEASDTLSVTIDPKSVTTPTIQLFPDSYEYDGTAKEPSVTVLDGDTEISDSEYKVEYSNNTNVGTATVEITDNPNGNYTVNGTKNFTITKRLLSNAVVSVEGGSFPYNGQEQKPSVTVTYNDVVVPAEEYTVSYVNNKNAGNATVTVTAVADKDYEGSKDATFTIDPKPITAVVTAADKHFDGNRNATVTAQVSNDDLASGDAITIGGLTGTFDDANVGTDKVVTVDRSKATITGNGSVNYAITIPETTTADIARATVTITWTATAQSVEYTGAQAVITAPTVTGENNVAVTVALTYSYAKQGEDTFTAGLPTDTGTYTVRASLAQSDNLTAAQADMTLTISPKELGADAIMLEKGSYEYTGTAITPAVTVKDGEKEIPPSEYTVTYSGNINVSTNATVIITDNSGGNYTVSGTKTFTITKPLLDNAEVTLSENSYTYDGTAKTPTVTVKKGGNVLAVGTDYTVAYSNNKNVSIAAAPASVTVTGMGNYGGGKTANFTITAKTLTPTITGNTTKTYDGTTGTNSDLAIDLAGKVNGDDVTASATAYAYNSPNVKEADTITATGITLGGADKDNYTLSATTVSASGSITKETGGAPPAANEGYTINYVAETITVTEGYEVSTKNDGTGTAVSGSVAGYFGQTLYIRKVADDNHDASGWTPLTLTARPTTPTPTATKETLKGQKNGKVSSVNDTMQYRENEGAWKDVPASATEITGLAGNTKVEVRVKATTGAPTSEIASCTVEAGAPITVTFDQGGQAATGMPAPQTGLSYNGTAARPDDPAPSDADHAFTGWYTDAACTTKYEFTTPLTAASLTLYAGWKQVKFKVSGKVEDNDGNAVSGATVKLMQGSQVIEHGTSGADGAFAFQNHVRVGAYNVVTTHGVQTKTSLVTITNQDAAVNVKLPPAGVNSKLEVTGMETPAVVVGGLDDEATTMEDADASVEKVTVSMTVESKSEAQAEGAAKIKEVATTGTAAPVLEFLDIAITAVTTRNGGTTETKKLDQTTNVMELVVPFLFKGKTDIKVYRYHDGNAEALNEVTGSGSPADQTYKKDEISGLIYIYTQKFSTYAIGYNSEQYTVTFDVNGGEALSSDSAKTGTDGKLSTLPKPTREGYPFLGWFTERDGGTEVTADTVFKADATLFAHWQEIVTPPSATCTITFNANGGSVSPASDETGADGKLSSLPTPTYSGYNFQGWFTEKDGGTKVTTGTVFEADATLYAHWAKKSGGGSSGGGGSSTPTPVQPSTPEASQPESPSVSEQFTDVPSGAWYREAVGFVVKTSLMTGYGNGNFGPDDNLSRAQLAQILFNKEGQPAGNGAGAFTDVAGNAWYASAVAWAATNGIVGGYGNGRFGPDDPITREQLALMLWRYAGNPAATDKELHFTDADKASAYARDALRWAVEKEILNGLGDGRLDPGGLATRAQAAQMLKRYFEDQ